MPYRILQTGEVVTDTPEEALAYSRLLAGVADQTDNWSRFYNLASQPKLVMQRKVLALVYGRGDAGITLDELVKLVEAQSSHVITGVINGICRNAVEAGLEATEIIVSLHGHEYRAGRLLLENEPPTP